MLAVSNYLDEQNVNHILRHRIKKHVEFYLMRKTAFDESRIFSHLPLNLRKEVIIQSQVDITPRILFLRYEHNQMKTP